MNFKPPLAALVVDRQKTVTRRAISTNPRSPWHEGLELGKRVAVCPGRGKNAIAHVIIDACDPVRLGDIDERDARWEGFGSVAEFEAAWMLINRGWNADELVWRIEFHLEPAPGERDWLADVREVLADAYHPEGTDAWLNSRTGQIDRQVPGPSNRVLIGRGHGGSVLAWAQQTVGRTLEEIRAAGDAR